MRWKQFFTPVDNVTPEQARAVLTEADADEVTLLDVRQPKEYETGHIPGAVLAPLPELSEHLDRLDPARPTIVYCAVGGRSRVAAQILSGKGFTRVLNLKGGINAWEGAEAFGPEDAGLALFSGAESLAEILVVAYGLERGLGEVYRTLAEKTLEPAAAELFSKLAAIEKRHMDRVWELYEQAASESDPAGVRLDRSSFEATVLPAAMEGGLTLEEHLARSPADLTTTRGVLDLAMGIEAQAMDLYQRTAEKRPKGTDAAGTRALLQIANEEREHLRRLGELMDALA